MKVKQLIPIFVLSILLLPLASGGQRGGTTLIKPPWNHCLGLNRVTQFHLDLYSGYRARFDDPQGIFCIKLDSEDDGDTDKDDDELTVFGLNSGGNQLIYNKGLTSIGIIGGEGEVLMEFRHPFSLSGDADGNVYVADSGNDRLVHLRYLENDELVYMGEIRGEGKDALEGPRGVTFSGGMLYVADTGNDRIAVFDSEGSIRASLRPRGEEGRLIRF